MHSLRMTRGPEVRAMGQPVLQPSKVQRQGYRWAGMTNICEALNRPIREVHPEVATALAVKTDLLSSGVAVDEHARVTIENEASKLYEASPWTEDMRAAEIVGPAPVQTADRVPPESVARDMAFAKLQSRILSAAEAVQAVKVHCEMLPEQQATPLSAGGTLALARAGRPCTSHRQNWHRMRNGGWPRR